MRNVLFDLYLECFPEYPTDQATFNALLKPEEAHVIYAKNSNGDLIGFSMLHGHSISLLCVKESYRRKGYGSFMLAESEKYIMDAGAHGIVLGHGLHYILQGVPNSAEAVTFFEHRGYAAAWVSANMELPLDGFDPAALNIPPKPDKISFRFTEESDNEALINAVDDAQPSWTDIFKDCADPIMLALRGDNIVGFQILAPEGGHFCMQEGRTGSIGCVGVVHAARELGIGRQMVVHGAEWLKGQGCAYIELRYVEMVDWYSRIGFAVKTRQWMGEKTL